MLKALAFPKMLDSRNTTTNFLEKACLEDNQYRALIICTKSSPLVVYRFICAISVYWNIFLSSYNSISLGHLSFAHKILC